MKLFQMNVIRRIVASILMITMVISTINMGSLRALAYEPKTGMICRDDGALTEVKDAPSETATTIGELTYGKPVTVIGEVLVEDVLWYQIAYDMNDGNINTNNINDSNEDDGTDDADETDGVDETDETDETDEVELGAYVLAEFVLLDENAKPYAIGTITGDDVYVRNEAGTNGTYKLVSLYKGHEVEILAQTMVNGTNVWYRIRCVVDEITYIGWTSGNYITIKEYVYEPDLEFEEQMRTIGFPESYIGYLSALHARYPEWQFTPVFTGLTWDEVIENESVPNRNLVSATGDDAKKSVSSSDYNWYTNTWVLRDSGKWVTAHPDYIAYCMDPRNFLNETYIFMFEGLSFSSIHNLSGVETILDGTFMMTDVVDTDGTTLNYAGAFMSIGEEINVSPYHLAARVVQEQGTKGTSPLISGTYEGYEGYFNFFNIGASGKSSSEVILNGLARAKKEGWTTRLLSLKGGGQVLAKNYINKGQDTLYFQKFNVVYKEGLYWHQYMQNLTAAQSEGKKVGLEGYTDKHQAFMFRIPVYENMPETAVEFNVTGNRNNYLATLEVSSGLSLTPDFDAATTSYSLIVDYGVDSINVGATAVVSKSTITGTGTYNLEVGNNVITVKCQSQSGDVKEYTLNVVRLEKVEEPEETYSFTSEVYLIGEYITKVKPETQVTDFVNGFVCDNCTIKVLNADGTENTGVVGTGNKVAVYMDEELKATYEVIVYGDVDGNGDVSVLDMIRVKRHILGLATLSDTYLLAADVNETDGGVSILDMISMKRHILGLALIEK